MTKRQKNEIRNVVAELKELYQILYGVYSEADDTFNKHSDAWMSGSYAKQEEELLHHLYQACKATMGVLNELNEVAPPVNTVKPTTVKPTKGAS